MGDDGEAVVRVAGEKAGLESREGGSKNWAPTTWRSASVGSGEFGEVEGEVFQGTREALDENPAVEMDHRSLDAQLLDTAYRFPSEACVTAGKDRATD